MHILDLTDKYLSEGPRYTRHLPWFFDHYYSFWAKRSQTMSAISLEEVATRRTWILNSISDAEKALADVCPDVLKRMVIVLMVGCGTSNGHVFLNDDGTPVAWIAIEAYATERLVRAFVLHEIIHAVQYGTDTASAFTTPEEILLIGRQAVTEGIATWITSSILGILAEEALWADSLTDTSRTSWMNECTKRIPEIGRRMLDKWTSSDPNDALFYANDPRDILSYRAGYFMGYEVIRCIALENAMTPKDLLALPYKDLENRFSAKIMQMIEG